jgi:hypothetical protein
MLKQNIFYIFLDRIIKEINEMGVSCFSGICSEIYLEKAFSKIKLKLEKLLPNAKNTWRNCLNVFG